MYRTFNMGIGLVLACAEASVEAVLDELRRAGESEAGIIGRVVEGDGPVQYKEPA